MSKAGIIVVIYSKLLFVGYSSNIDGQIIKYEKDVRKKRHTLGEHIPSVQDMSYWIHDVPLCDIHLLPLYKQALQNVLINKGIGTMNRRNEMSIRVYQGMKKKVDKEMVDKFKEMLVEDIID